MPEPATPQIDAQSLLRVMEVTRQLSAPCDLHEMLERVIEAGRQVLLAERGTVFLLDESRQQLYSSVGTGVSSGEIRIEIDQGIAGLCARTRNVINVADCAEEPRFSRRVDEQTGYHTRSMLSIPLIGFEGRLVGVLQMLNPSRRSFSREDEHIAQVLASQAAVALQRAQLLEERLVKLKLERDLDLARQIQQGVLPDQPPVVPGYDLACLGRPADRTGGDIYDFVHPVATDGSEGAMMVMLADATGHGIGPALSVTQVRAMFRIGLRLGAGLDDLVTRMNAQLIEDLASNRFVTAFLGRLDPRRHVVEYHAAGQGPVLHYHAADQRCSWHMASSPPLGVVNHDRWDQPPPLVMQPGDVLGLITDGVYEQADRHGQLFGQDRVGQVINEHHASGAAALLEELMRTLETFADGAGQQDDLTALIIQRQV